MSKPHFINFLDGPLADSFFASPETVEKVVVQFASNHTVRYEHVEIRDTGEYTNGFMRVTDSPSFDDDMAHDEAKGIE